MSITITKTAAEHAQKHITSRGKGIGLRLGVKTTGCSGLAYIIEFADKIENDDKVFEDNGIKLIINPKSYVYLKGTQLDFSKEGINEGFKFKNPNVKDTCGCGESFNV
ncbi:MAG: iron-sulfur cluster assembly protein IscA [Gammaproteobacteria bacterium]|nr:iron-sulfur cluster assembly protein IscA [Gammaproteobacteria bacterium]